jgi:hypothetical protein
MPPVTRPPETSATRWSMETHMCIWISFATFSRSYSMCTKPLELRAHDSISNTIVSSRCCAEKRICPASRCPWSVTRRNEVGVRSAMRTGPSHGPAIRTRYSSPTPIRPGSPWSFKNDANSLGDTESGSAAMRSSSSSAVIRASRMRVRYVR